MSTQCPACGYANETGALTCTMCKRILRRSHAPIPSEGSVLPFHAIELPGASAAPIPIELGDRRNRPSGRPIASADAPGANPTSARTLSHFPQPITGEPRGALERALDVIATPYDRLVWLSAQRGSLAVRIAALVAQVVGVALALGGLVRLADRLLWPSLVLGGLALGLALLAASRCSRAIEAARDPHPVASLGATVFPFVFLATVALGALGGLFGVIAFDPDLGLRLAPGARSLVAAGVFVYVVLAGAALARDRARRAREPG